MKIKIDYMLYTNKKLEIEEYNVEADYEVDTKLSFDKMSIDLVNQTFYRECDEYSMLIDFKENTCKFEFDEHESITDIESSFEYANNKIKLSYSFGEETKKINIELKVD